MFIPKDPRELAVAMISRSTCTIQVGAVLADNWGIHAWGHNHVGFDGYGCHAEVECMRRANRRRIEGSTMYVAAQRQRNGKMITAKPCELCKLHIAVKGCRRVVWRGADGMWYEL